MAGDITYENLMAARTANKSDTGEFDIMSMANLALKILEQVQVLKGGNQTPMASRPVQQQTAVQKPAIDAEKIMEALTTIKGLKGDIKITELQKLLKENKDEVNGLLARL